MAQSSITLPIAVEDKAALAELKRIQSALGAVGKESASLNKAISDSMEAMTSKLTQGFGDIASKGSGVGGSGLLGKVTQLSFSFNEVKAAIQGVAEVVKEALNLAKFSADLERMKGSVPTVALQQMTAATKGTVAQVDLLRFASTALQGSLRLTTSGMTTVTAAAQNLADRGLGETTKIMDEMMNAIRTGQTETLEKWGIQIKKTGDAQRDLNNLMAELAKQVMTPMNIDPAMRSIQRLQKITTDWINDVKEGLGQAVLWAVNLFDKVSDWLAGVKSHMTKEDQAHENAVAQLAARHGSGDSVAGWKTGEFITEENKQIARLNSEDLKMMSGQIGGQIANVLSMAAGAGTAGKPSWHNPTSGGGNELGFFDSFIGKFTRPAWGYNLGQAANEIVSDQQWQETQNGITNAAGAFGKFAGGIGGALEAGVGANDKRARDRQDQLDLLKSQLDDTSNVAGAAFQTLSQGLTAAVDAAISGSDSIGKAAMKAAATVLKSIALQAVGRAAFEVALAIAEPPLAGQHLAAAAKFGVAAALAGGLAAAAGSAGGGGGSGASAGRSGAGSAAGVVTPNVQQGAQSQTIIVNVTGATTSGDYQKLGETITKAIDAGKQAGRVRSDSSVTVRYE